MTPSSRTCHFATAPSDADLTRFVESWIDRLAAGDFEGAYRATDHDPYYRWSAELLKEVVEGYGLPGGREGRPRCRVTPRATARAVPRKGKSSVVVCCVRRWRR